MKVNTQSLSFLLSGAASSVLPLVYADNHDLSPLASIVTTGTRPYSLLDLMKNSTLKDDLYHCANTKTSMVKSDFSIGHRGAAMQYPEHTFESYKAAALQGAGIIECDVTFTKDKELVCRHSQCDLHTTTDVVTRPEMNAKCTVPFEAGSGVSPNCCTSDFTLAELKTLCAKMDSSGGVNATSAESYAFGGTPDWRTDLYQHRGEDVCPRIPTHKESIEFIKSLGGKFTPELKTPSVEMPYEGNFTQEAYAQKMIDEYIELGIPPEDVWPQSFRPEDVIYWVNNTDYGEQGVALDESHLTDGDYREWHQMLVDNGVKIVAPALWMLVTSDATTSELGILPSDYASSAQEHGLDIIAWTLERSPPGLTGDDVWYWQSLQDNDLNDGDKFALLHVLSGIGTLGVFSDWPATTTFYANCMGLGLREASTDADDDTESGSTEFESESAEVESEATEDESESIESDPATAEDTSNAGTGRALKVAARFFSIGLRLVGV